MKKYWLFMVVSVLLLVGSACLTIAFWTKHTEFFTRFSLMDPSASKAVAGYWLGLVISVITTASVAFGLVVFVLGVLPNVPAYEAASRVWKKSMAGLIAGTTRPMEVADELRKVLPARTRLAVVLAAWQSSNHDTDPDSLLEGAASFHRQMLSVLHTMASILVLIGLIGNFVGLAGAVKELPKLYVSGAPTTAPAKSVTTTEQKPIDNKNAKQVYVDRTSVAPPVQAQDNSGQQIQTQISEISDGLSVVVVSSVMGISGMILLLLYVTWLRGIFNTQLAEEASLMCGEIAPVLSPGQRSLHDLGALAETMSSIPAALELFQHSTSTLATAVQESTFDTKTIVQQLQQLLQGQLEEAHKSYLGYQQSLREFTTVMQDDRAMAVELAQTSTKLHQTMVTVGERLTQVMEGFQTIHRSNTESQAHYENYMRLVSDLVSKEHVQTVSLLEQATSSLKAGSQEIATSATRLLEQNSLGLREVAKEEGVALERLQEQIVKAIAESERANRQETLSLQRVAQAAIQDNARTGSDYIERMALRLKGMHDEVVDTLTETNRLVRTEIEKVAQHSGEGLKELVTTERELLVTLVEALRTTIETTGARSGLIVNETVEVFKTETTRVLLEMSAAQTSLAKSLEDCSSSIDSTTQRQSEIGEVLLKESREGFQDVGRHVATAVQEEVDKELRYLQSFLGALEQKLADSLSGTDARLADYLTKLDRKHTDYLDVLQDKQQQQFSNTQGDAQRAYESLEGGFARISSDLKGSLQQVSEEIALQRDQLKRFWSEDVPAATMNVWRMQASVTESLERLETAVNSQQTDTTRGAQSMVDGFREAMKDIQFLVDTLRETSMNLDQMRLLTRRLPEDVRIAVQGLRGDEFAKPGPG